MSEAQANLCATCPARGLCVGPVVLKTQALTYEVEKSQYPGVAVIGRDQDGVTTDVVKVTPETYDVPGRRGQVNTYATNPSDARRSTLAYDALASDPDRMLHAIADRADRCEAPLSTPTESAFAVSYRRTCRTVATAALEKLAKPE